MKAAHTHPAPSALERALLVAGANDSGVADSPAHRAMLARLLSIRAPSAESADALYARIARGGEGESAFLAGPAAMRRFGYGAWVRQVPPQLAARFVGLGCPWRAGLPAVASHVVDLGCGAGVDSWIAARSGARAWGVDIRDVLRPQADAFPTGVRFTTCSAEGTDVPVGWADLLIANGLPQLLSPVLAPPVLAEATRILRPHGEMRVVALVAQLARSDDADLVLAARRTGKPLRAELLRVFEGAGLVITAVEPLPSPYRAEPHRSMIDAVLVVARRA